MRRYNYLQAIYLAFFSRALYRDVVKNWGAGTALYLLMLLAICWAVMFTKIQPLISHFADKYVPQITAQFPANTSIKNGIVTTSENRPYFIKSEDQKSVWAVIDTSGHFKSIAATHAHVLITKTEIFYLDNDKIKSRPIPTDVEVDINAQALEHTLDFYLHWAWIFLFPIFLLITFIYRFLLCLIFAVIGKIFAAIIHGSLHYLDVLKLSMIAITPDIVLTTVCNWLGYWLTWGWLIFMGISLAYLIFGIFAVKKQTQEE